VVEGKILGKTKIQGAGAGERLGGATLKEGIESGEPILTRKGGRGWGGDP